MILLNFLDKFFYLFHSLLILFNLLGWIWPKTRKIHLASVILTSLSWFVLGLWFGQGYCPCTDWHWQVRMKLGHYDLPDSYIKLLLDGLTGWDVGATKVENLTLLVWMFLLMATLFVNYQDWRRQKKY